MTNLSKFAMDLIWNLLNDQLKFGVDSRNGSRPAATSKMERKPLTIVTKRPILDVAVVSFV